MTTGYAGSTVNDDDSGVPTTINQSALGHFVANVFATESPLTLYHYGSGASGMTVNIGSAAVLGTQTGNVQAINGAITISSSDHCAVTVDDSNDTAPRNAILTSSTLSGLAPADITYPYNNTLIVYGSAAGTNIALNSITSVTEFDGGAGADTVNIESVSTNLGVYGGGGTDTINVTPQGKNLDAIPGTLDLTASASSTLNVNDQNNANFLINQDYITNVGVTRLGQTIVQGQTVFHVGGMAYTGFGNITLNTGAVVTVVNVISNFASVTVNGGSGDVSNVIGDSGAPHSALGITAPVTINGGAGSQISLDDSGVSVPVTVHITPTQVGAVAGDNFFGPGGQLNYSGTSSLNLTTSNASGGDKIYARPSATTAYTINGALQGPALGALPGDPLGSGPTSGDVLIIADADATNPQSIPGANGAGQYTFGNRMSVNYTGVEQTSQDLVPPSVVNPSFQFNTFPQSLVVPFSENLGSAPLLPSFSVLPSGLGQPTPVALTGVSYVGTTATVGIQGMLPDGNYSATVFGAGISDVPGNAMSGNAIFNFFMLSADANHDRFVNTIDFVALAANFNQVSGAGLTYSQGDFNYDGKVNALDFNILAAKFGTQLLPAGSGPVVNSATTTTSKPIAASPLASLFSDRAIASPLTSDVLFE